jgi:hypothetical protein
MNKRFNKKMIFFVFVSLGFLAFLSNVLVARYDFKNKTNTAVELTLNSFSPNGKAGGVMVPASCESGYVEQIDGTCIFDCGAGLCSWETCWNGANWVGGSVSCPIATCGTANGAPSLSVPSVDLCGSGFVASLVGGNGTNDSPWAWSCSGSGAGNSVYCSSKKPCVYSNYNCNTRSAGDTTCEGLTYPANCGKILDAHMLCNRTDTYGSCSAGGFPTQQDCMDNGVACSDTKENCPRCIKIEDWKEIAP